jgi:hypothetical protein
VLYKTLIVHAQGRGAGDSGSEVGDVLWKQAWTRRIDFFSQGFLLFSVLTVPVNSFRFLHYPEEANTVYFAANMIMPRYGNLG